MKFLFMVLAGVLPVVAQSGDKPGEAQPPPPADWNIPAAPPLTPEEALKTFRLPPGFEMQVAASDPLIEAPVEIEFDPAGRMYVLEMRGFMPNVDGKGEDQPLGRVTLLEDADGDGRFEKGTVFADGLVMPRAIAVVRGGLLVAEPPQLWFFADRNGDGKADEKTLVSNDYGSQANPEHTANGLLWGRDNWIYSANHTVRYQNINGEWEKDGTRFRGQWGITQDDYGRLFFNSNSDQFRGDLVPAHYLSRNGNFKSPTGANVQLARDQATFPMRINPGVNRGYQKGTLRQDGTLAKFTGACGPLIYRGELFPREYYGAGFLCEPTANIVRCNFLRENEGYITATNAFPQSEFLASSDERFRPVNLANGPDGALYVVDMYRGVIQHRIYITTFLRNQALDRKLETPLNQGRIYRVVPAGYKPRKAVLPGKLKGSELVAQLNSTNGWMRDTAQQLLVERADSEATEPLQALASRGVFPGSIHALWVLHALEQNSAETITSALRSKEPKVRATAIRVGEGFLRAEGSNSVARDMLALVDDPSADVQLQLMFSLGQTESPEAEAAMIRLLERNFEHPLIRDAAITGLGGRELRFLQQLVARPSFQEKSPGKVEVLKDLAQCVAESRDPKAAGLLLDTAVVQKQVWVQQAILDGFGGLIIPAARGKEPQAPKPIRFAAEPRAIAALAGTPELQSRMTKIDPLLVWPGKAGHVEAEVKPLTEGEQALFEKGREMYIVICGACHQQNGQGLDGLAPPLVDSDWTIGSPDRLTRIVLHGMRGPVNVKGRVWEMEMPPLNVMSDEDIAGLLTYVRREWGHTASAVTPEFVGKVRKETGNRIEAWTEAELLKLK